VQRNNCAGINTHDRIATEAFRVMVSVQGLGFRLLGESDECCCSEKLRARNPEPRLRSVLASAPCFRADIFNWSDLWVTVWFGFMVRVRV
jgi:hypothetical protein